MARVTVEDCLEECPDHFALVRLAALRTREIQRGAKPQVECKNKEIVTALREIAAGHVQFRENVEEVLLRAQSLAQLSEERLVDSLEHIGEPLLGSAE